MLKFEFPLFMLSIFFLLFSSFNFWDYFRKNRPLHEITFNFLSRIFLFFLVLLVLSLTYIFSQSTNSSECLFLISLILVLSSCFLNLIRSLIQSAFLATEKHNLEMITILVQITELKDEYTKGHSEHVSSLVDLICNNLPDHLKNKISKNKLIQAALLHDIGKILVPREILIKKSPLTEQEYEKIKKHTEDGWSILKSIDRFKEMAPWVKYHHERIDGNGYYGLKEHEIPLEAKIIAVADTYSALTTNRAYRYKMSPTNAIKVLKSVSGTQLDCEIVEVLVELIENKLRISSDNLISYFDKDYQVLIKSCLNYKIATTKSYKNIAEKGNLK